MLAGVPLELFGSSVYDQGSTRYVYFVWRAEVHRRKTLGPLPLRLWLALRIPVSEKALDGKHGCTSQHTIDFARIRSMSCTTDLNLSSSARMRVRS